MTPESEPESETTTDPGTDPTAQATASPTPSPVDTRIAGAGTYRLRLQLAGEELAGERIFVVG